MPMGKPDSELAKAMIAGLTYEAENAKWIDEQDAERMMHVPPYEGFAEDEETEDADVEAVEEMTADEAEEIADEEAVGEKGIKSVSPFRGRKNLLPKSRKGGPKVMDVSLCPKCRRLVDWDRGGRKFTEHENHKTGRRCEGSGGDVPQLPPLDPDPEWNRKGTKAAPKQYVATVKIEQYRKNPRLEVKVPLWHAVLVDTNMPGIGIDIGDWFIAGSSSQSKEDVAKMAVEDIKRRTPSRDSTVDVRLIYR